MFWISQEKQIWISITGLQWLLFRGRFWYFATDDFHAVTISILIKRLTEINIVPLTVLFCNCLFDDL